MNLDPRIIFPDSQKCAHSAKNRKSQIEQKILNSFEFNSNGFELGLGKRKVQKCSYFWRSPGKREKKYWARFGDQLEAEKAWGYICKCVPVNSNKWNI